MQLSLSRLNRGLPRGEDEPGMIEGTADVPHQITDTHLPAAASVFDAAIALDTAMDMVDLQLTLVELLVRHVLLPRELLPQIEINSTPFCSFGVSTPIYGGLLVTAWRTRQAQGYDL
jgi:hypothetical protein